MVTWTFDGARIVVARNSRDMSQADLARLLSLAPQQLLAWEKGNVVPGADKIAALSTALQCPPRFFFVTSGEQVTHQTEDAA